MPEEGTIPRYWIQKNRNIVRESHQNHKVFTKQFPVSKETHKLRILKPKDFITLQNILFVYDCLEKERMKSFNTILNKWMLINFTIQDPLMHTNWKNEILKQKNMAPSLYWSNVYQTGNLLENALKTNFKKIKCSEIKTLVTYHFLDKYTKW